MNQPIHNPTTFVHLDYVRAVRGLAAYKVNELIESGELLWVFDFRGDSKRRSYLRFWSREIENPLAVRNLDLEDVISNVLPRTRLEINGSEMCRWFLLSRQMVGKMAKKLNGVVRDRLWRVKREALADYLRARWIGGVA